MNWFKIMAHVVLIPIIGFIMLNITFLIVALIRMGLRPYFFAQHAVSVSTILVLSFGLLRIKKMPQLIKASITMVPVAIILVYIGIMFYTFQSLVYILSAMAFGAIVFLLYTLKTPWIYYYSVLVLSAALLYLNWMGIDI